MCGMGKYLEQSTRNSSLALKILMTGKEDWVCLDKLLATPAHVLSPSFFTHSESRERINELSRQIEEDYRTYKDGRCGSFKALVDQEVQAQFQMALLVVSSCADKNNQELPQATLSFSDKELEVCDLLKRCYLLDAYSVKELREKLLAGDPTVKSFFTGYATLRQSITQLAGHEEIRPAVRQYLKKQEDRYNRKCETAFGSQGGEFIVTSSLARQREFDFISRIEYNLKSSRNGITFSGQCFTIENIAKGDTGSNRSKQSDPVHDKRSRPADNLPKNQYVTAVFTEKSITWRKKSLIFYAVFISHIEKYRETGFDAKPLELKEIPAYLNPDIVESLKKHHHILFCIASPTGFGSIAHPGSDDQMLTRFISSDVTVCFLDLHNNKPIFNEFDKKSIELSEICDLETKGEKHLKLKEILYREMDRKLLVNQSVSLKYCIEFSANHEHPDPGLVENLFTGYAREKHLTIKNIPPMGPVIIIP